MSAFALEYLTVVERILGSAPPPADESRLLIREQACGPCIPAALHEFYRVAHGAYALLWGRVGWTGVDPLLSPENWRWEGEMLMIHQLLEAKHGLARQDLFCDDPPIWWSHTAQAVQLDRLARQLPIADQLALPEKSPEIRWRRSGTRLSTFLSDQLYQQAVFGGLPHQRFAAIDDATEQRIAAVWPHVLQHDSYRVYALDGEVLRVTGDAFADIRGLAAAPCGPHSLAVGARTDEHWRHVDTTLGLSWLAKQ